MDGKDIRFQKIITGIKTRDLAVQEQIYKSYWGYLMAVCLRYLNDRDVAMEVVNDSFIKAFKIIFEFRFDDDGEVAHKMFKSWLTKIAVRTALDSLRSKRSYLSYTDDYQEVPEDYVAVESKLHAADILSLLEEIPDLHRTVFNLYEIEGFSHEEVSGMLKIPASSSRTYLTRAKMKLRELYKIKMES